MEKQETKLFLQCFSIEHLSDLIGRKFLINLQLPRDIYDFGPNEICFQIQYYDFSSQNLCFVVPTIGLEGNSDMKDIILSFFPNEEKTGIEYGISFSSDYHKSETFSGKMEYVSVTGKKGSKNLRVKLL